MKIKRRTTIYQAQPTSYLWLIIWRDVVKRIIAEKDVKSVKFKKGIDLLLRIEMQIKSIV
jgi:hypothetical protein